MDEDIALAAEGTGRGRSTATSGSPLNASNSRRLLEDGSLSCLRLALAVELSSSRLFVIGL